MSKLSKVTLSIILCVAISSSSVVYASDIEIRPNTNNKCNTFSNTSSSDDVEDSLENQDYDFDENEQSEDDYDTDFEDEDEDEDDTDDIISGETSTTSNELSEKNPLKDEYGTRTLKKKTITWKLKNGDYYIVRYALETAGNDNKHKYIIKVPKGTYTTDRIWTICGKDITLDLRKVTFKRPKNVSIATNFFRIGFNDKGKYKGAQNIKILGGTLDNGTGSRAYGLMHIAHAKNIKIQGTTFKYLPKKKLGVNDGNPHMIETSAVKNITISKCKFYNNSNCKENNEAVQFESNSNTKDMIAHCTMNIKRDGTTSSHITVTKCYFKGFRYGCGSNHLAAKDKFKYMKFTDNTFVGATKYAICLFRFDHVTIKGNKLTNCGSLYQNQFSTNISVVKVPL